MGVMKIAVRGEDWRNGYGKEKNKDERFFLIIRKKYRGDRDDSRK